MDTPPLTPDQQYQLDHASDNKDALIISVSVILIVLTTLAIVLRFTARYTRNLALGVDDWCALVAWAFAIPLCALNIANIQFGLGRHTLANVAEGRQPWKVVKIGWFFTLIYTIVHFWIKFSILFFYHRVFSFRTAWFRYACYFCGVYAVAWTVSSFCVTCFQCWPVQHFWQQLDPTRMPPSQGTCHLDNSRAALSFAALNSLLDILIFVLPIAILWNLHMKKTRKLSLIAVFATGAFAIAAGILRLSSSYLSIKPGADATWIVADVLVWTTVEASVGIICASMPIIGPLFGVVKDNVRSYLSKQSLHSGSHGIPLSGRSGTHGIPLSGRSAQSGSTTQLNSSLHSHSDSLYVK